MKKFTLVLLILCAVLVFSACEKTEYPTFEEKGMEIIGIIEDMINSEKYLEIYGMSDDVVDIVDSAAEGDYSEAEHIYEIKISDDIEDVLGVELDGLPKSIKKIMKAKLPATFISLLNSRTGSSSIAAAAMTTASTTFLTDETESTLFIYTFEDGTPIAVAYAVNDEGICSASGTFLFGADDYDFSSAKNLEDSLGVEVDVKKIK